MSLGVIPSLLLRREDDAFILSQNLTAMLANLDIDRIIFFALKKTPSITP
jgi:hypothetical protein